MIIPNNHSFYKLQQQNQQQIQSNLQYQHQQQVNKLFNQCFSMLQKNETRILSNLPHK